MITLPSACIDNVAFTPTFAHREGSSNEQLIHPSTWSSASLRSRPNAGRLQFVNNGWGRRQRWQQGLGRSNGHRRYYEHRKYHDYGRDHEHGRGYRNGWTDLYGWPDQHERCDDQHGRHDNQHGRGDRNGWHDQ